MSSLPPVQAVSPSEAVVETVASREDVDPTELTPLYESIDSEALDSLVEAEERDDGIRQIAFTYHGYRVTITGDGVVDVDEMH